MIRMGRLLGAAVSPRSKRPADVSVVLSVRDVTAPGVTGATTDTELPVDDVSIWREQFETW